MRYFSTLALLLFYHFTPAQTQIGSDIDGAYPGEWAGWAVDMNYDGSRLVVGSLFGGAGDHPEGIDGAVRAYEFDGENWEPLGNALLHDTLGHLFGYSVEMSDDGNRIAVGMPSYDTPNTGAGGVQVFEFDNGQWVPLGNRITGEGGYQQAGFSISLSAGGDTVAVASPGYGDWEGRVRVFHLVGGSWVILGEPILNQTIYERLGWDIALSGDGSFLAAGAPHYSINGIFEPEGRQIGQVRFYQFDGAAWEEAYEPLQGIHDGETFGTKLALSKNGNRLAVSLSGYDDLGRTDVFGLSGDSWVKVGQSIYRQDSYNLNHDLSISDDGSRVAISYNSSFGLTQLFEWDGGSWMQLGQDISGEELADLAGTSIALSGNGQFIAIGATHNNGGGAAAGQVRVFGFNPTSVRTKKNSETEVALYPTVVSDAIFLDAGTTWVAQAEIYNLLGHKAVEIQNPGHNIDLSSLSRGAYVMYITMEGGECVIRRFLKINF